MKSFTIIGIVFLLGVAPICAKIGETLDQCKARYGDVQETALKDDPRGISKCYVFKKNGMEIMVRLYKNKVGWVKYSAPGYLTQKQREQLLALNKGETQWLLDRTERTKNEKILYEEVWVYNSKDKKLQAHFSHPDYPSVTASIYTKELASIIGFYRN